MHILVVDDQPTNRAVLTWLLEEDGHRIAEAENGADAVNIYQQEDIDIVLMDVLMPVMDGLEATRQIKKLQGDNSGYIPVIFLTALDDDEALSKCLASGGDDFLAKPYNESILKAKIKAHLRIKELMQQIAKNNKELKHYNSLWEREQNIVEHIFTTASKHNLSDCNNLKSYIAPASTFNGDLLLSAPSPSGGLYVFLGDFTGHGLGASIGTLPIAHTFDQLCNRHLSVGEIASDFNRILVAVLPDFMFCAATILEMNAVGDSVQIWMGGLPDAYIIDENGKLKERLESANMPLGVEHDETFNKAFEVKYLSQGERIFLYTDGLDEAQNPHGDFFSIERLECCFDGQDSEILEKVVRELKTFSGEAEQADDITIVEVLAGPVSVSEQQQDTGAQTGIRWNMNTELTANDIKHSNAVEEVMNILGVQTTLRPHRDVIGLLIAELYSNALEHGILGLSSDLKKTEEGFIEYYEQRELRLNGLDSASIRMNFGIVHEPEAILKIRFQDSGKGFDHKKLTSLKNENAFGRGIALLNRVCTRVEYTEGGRCVEVDFPIEYSTKH